MSPAPTRSRCRCRSSPTRDHAAAPDDGDRHPNFPNHLLGGRLLELLRIRSGQLGGCEPCMGSRKNATITDDDVACLINPALRPDLDERERRALAFLDLLSNDHWAIDDDVYRGLGEVFTTAEIVELGQTCGGMIGLHRFLHTLDPLGDEAPVIAYDPKQVGTHLGRDPRNRRPPRALEPTCVSRGGYTPSVDAGSRSSGHMPSAPASCSW